MTIWNWLMLAVFFAGYGLDFYESWILRPKAGREEGHQWFSKPDGGLNRRAALLICSGIYTAFFIFTYWLGNAAKADHQTYNVGLYTATGFLCGAGITHAIMGWHNIRKDKKALGQL